MNRVDFQKLRRDLDEAMTFHDLARARRLAGKGLKAARRQEVVGEMFYLTAQLKIIEENYDEAIKYLDQAIAANPHDGAAYNDRALCMVEQGILDEALVYFDKGIMVEPDYATVYHNKGWLLNQLGHHRKAIPYFEKALALESERCVSYENLADALFHLGRLDEAIEAVQAALKLLKPGCRDIKNQLKERLTFYEGSRRKAAGKGVKP